MKLGFRKETHFCAAVISANCAFGLSAAYIAVRGFDIVWYIAALILGLCVSQPWTVYDFWEQSLHTRRNNFNDKDSGDWLCDLGLRGVWLLGICAGFLNVLSTVMIAIAASSGLDRAFPETWPKWAGLLFFFMVWMIPLLVCQAFLEIEFLRRRKRRPHAAQ